MSVSKSIPADLTNQKHKYCKWFPINLRDNSHVNNFLENHNVSVCKFVHRHCKIQVNFHQYAKEQSTQTVSVCEANTRICFRLFTIYRLIRGDYNYIGTASLSTIKTLTLVTS